MRVRHRKKKDEDEDNDNHHHHDGDNNTNDGNNHEGHHSDSNGGERASPPASPPPPPPPLAVAAAGMTPQSPRSIMNQTWARWSSASGSFKSASPGVGLRQGDAQKISTFVLLLQQLFRKSCGNGRLLIWILILTVLQNLFVLWVFDSSSSSTATTFPKRGHVTTVIVAGLVRDELSETAWDYLWQLNCLYDVHVHIMAANHTSIMAEKAKRFPCPPIPGKRPLTREAKNSPLALLTHSSSSSSSAFFHVMREPRAVRKINNRIDRLTYLRNYQREWLRPFVSHLLPKLAMVVADLDLQQFVPPLTLLQVAQEDLYNKDYQVLCSKGMMHRPYGYYDIFATVLQDGSFMYPHQARIYHDPRTSPPSIRSNDLLGDFSQAHLALHLERASVTPVKSCFGGTALYRGETFFGESCSYTFPAPTIPPPDPSHSPLWTYANIDDERVCEHVVFHSCLWERALQQRQQRQRQGQGRQASFANDWGALPPLPPLPPPSIIGISSKLVTEWDLPLQETNTIKAGGYLSEALVGRNLPHADGLLLWNRDLASKALEPDPKRFPVKDLPPLVTTTTTTTTTTTMESQVAWDSMGRTLRNGAYRLEINGATGRLEIIRQWNYAADKDDNSKAVVDGKNANANATWGMTLSEPVVVWTSSPAPIGFLPYRWNYLALLLSHDGVLLLVQQHLPVGTKEHPLPPERSCVRVSQHSPLCRSIIWSSGFRGNRRHSEFQLTLSKRGDLHVRDLLDQSIVWSSKPQSSRRRSGRGGGGGGATHNKVAAYSTHQSDNTTSTTTNNFDNKNKNKMVQSAVKEFLVHSREEAAQTSTKQKDGHIMTAKEKELERIKAGLLRYRATHDWRSHLDDHNNNNNNNNNNKATTSPETTRTRNKKKKKKQSTKKEKQLEKIQQELLHYSATHHDEKGGQEEELLQIQQELLEYRRGEENNKKKKKVGGGGKRTNASKKAELKRLEEKWMAHGAKTHAEVQKTRKMKEKELEKIQQELVQFRAMHSGNGGGANVEEEQEKELMKIQEEVLQLRQGNNDKKKKKKKKTTKKGKRRSAAQEEELERIKEELLAHQAALEKKKVKDKKTVPKRTSTTDQKLQQIQKPLAQYQAHGEKEKEDGDGRQQRQRQEEFGKIQEQLLEYRHDQQKQKKGGKRKSASKEAELQRVKEELLAHGGGGGGGGAAAAIHDAKTKKTKDKKTEKESAKKGAHSKNHDSHAKRQQNELKTLQENVLRYRAVHGDKDKATTKTKTKTTTTTTTTTKDATRPKQSQYKTENTHHNDPGGPKMEEKDDAKEDKKKKEEEKVPVVDPLEKSGNAKSGAKQEKKNAKEEKKSKEETKTKEDQKAKEETNAKDGQTLVVPKQKEHVVDLRGEIIHKDAIHKTGGIGNAKKWGGANDHDDKTKGGSSKRSIQEKATTPKNDMTTTTTTTTTTRESFKTGGSVGKMDKTEISAPPPPQVKKETSESKPKEEQDGKMTDKNKGGDKSNGVLSPNNNIINNDNNMVVFRGEQAKKQEADKTASWFQWGR